MENKQIPLWIDEIPDGMYGSFGARLGSLLLDFLFLLPLSLVTIYLNSLSRSAYFYTIVPLFLISLWYHVYLPKRYGGTPGKLIAGIKILRLNGTDIAWKEAFLRHLIELLLTVFVIVIMCASLLEASPEAYDNYNWREQTQYIISMHPGLFRLNTWLTQIWVWGELVVMLTNARKRAVHDFIAGTVIVKARYTNKIRETMYGSPDPGTPPEALTGLESTPQA